MSQYIIIYLVFLSLIQIDNDPERSMFRLSRHINTSAAEYLPVISSDGKKMFFTAMDRTGYFDFKMDFIKQKNAGGEDIFVSELVDGLWTDARPVDFLNTNRHEAVTQVLADESLILTANYDEKLGPRGGANTVQTTDIFVAKKLSSGYQILHLPEPVNSIYNEADGWTDDQNQFLLFVSDRPGGVGPYKQKGWKWRESFWGNTDVYVALKVYGEWSEIINLGSTVNTTGAERTPWLSDDNLTLYISSNGHNTDRTDLNIYSFKRKNPSIWTEWEGPFEVRDANSEYDDWGYKEFDSFGYFSRARDLSFTRTQLGVNGDGGVKEINFRTAYEVFGAQLASLSGQQDTDILTLHSRKVPSVRLEDVLFGFDSDELNDKAFELLERLLELCKMNEGRNIQILGHSDNIGNDSYNMELSKRRADRIAEYLKTNGVKQNINTIGLGSSMPLFPNNSEINREKNRRVEVTFQ